MKLRNKVLLLHHQNVIELWCNGNTTDSGPVILGSNPGSSTRNPRPFKVADFRFSLRPHPAIRPPARFPQRRRTDDTIIAKRHGRQPRFAKIARSRSDRVKNRTLSAMSFAISVLRRMKIPAIFVIHKTRRIQQFQKLFV